jgi:L-xylulokinase
MVTGFTCWTATARRWGRVSCRSTAGPWISSTAGGVMDRQALALTGQIPHVSAPSALLAWIRREQPDRFARIGHVLSCKDWLCHCLSGHIGTDRTEASTSFTDARSQVYSAEALALYGLSGVLAA